MKSARMISSDWRPLNGYGRRGWDTVCTVPIDVIAQKDVSIVHVARDFALTKGLEDARQIDKLQGYGSAHMKGDSSWESWWDTAKHCGE